jgi:hypothetical protein
MKPKISTEVWWNSLGPDDKAFVLNHSQSPGRPSDLELMTLPFNDLPEAIKTFIKSYHHGDWS